MPAPTQTVAPVTSDDPKGKKKEPNAADGKDSKEKQGDKEMSDEDVALQNELDMLAERLKESDTQLHRPALETLRTLIRTSTSSMTSVPKPLKFLRPLYPGLQAMHAAWPESDDKALFADILSVLAMTYSDTHPRGTLAYRLLAGSTVSEPGSWGHEYIRHLAAELGDEYTRRVLGSDAPAVPTPTTAPEAAPAAIDGAPPPPPPIDVRIEASTDDLHALGVTCARFLLRHNAEADAVDLLEELAIVDRLPALVDADTFARVAQYMVSCVPLLAPPDDVAFLRTAHDIYVAHARFPEALALAVRLGDAELVRAVFTAPANPLMQRQLAFILARAQVPFEWLFPADGEPPDLEPDLEAALSNTRLSTLFRAFGAELGVTPPRSLEEVYKSHLENTRVSSTVDSARANLAGTFVNAFVNAAFGNDTLMAAAADGQSWVYKNKDHGMMSAAASLGLSLLWDTDVGVNQVDKYTYSAEEFIKAGGLLATGILHCGVRDDVDAALALLSEHIDSASVPLRTGAIVGLGLAYAGAQRDALAQLLVPLAADDGLSMEVAALAALSLGLVFVGSAHGDIAAALLQTLMERPPAQLGEKWARFMALGLGLLYLGRQDACEATVEALKAVPHALSKQAQILVEVCAYAGSGNVLKVQSMLAHCAPRVKQDPEPTPSATDGATTAAMAAAAAAGAAATGTTVATGAAAGSAAAAADAEKKEEDKEDDTFQGFAVIGIALIAMGEDVGAEMSLRQFNHLMHYGDPVVRRAVPLALGLLSASNPSLPLLDTLSRYSHDNDLPVALNAVFAMGLIGAGTNNARLAQMLRQLAGYYAREADALFMVRIAQGLVQMGKGALGLAPFACDRAVMVRPAVAGLLATLVSLTDAKAFVLDKAHWMLFLLTPAIQPRFLVTLDAALDPLAVSVRVGQAVDVVGQAGKPRTISGFQTHTTPVRLATTERAELATEEWVAFASVLEGCVILQKNPAWESEDKMET